MICPPGSTVRVLLQILLLACVYVVSGHLGLGLDPVGGFATLVWPPTGIALSALLLGGIRLWPGVALGAFLVNLWNGAPPLVACGVALGNTLEAMVSVWVFRRIAGRSPALDRLRAVVTLLIPIAGLCTLVSATIGAASLIFGGVISSDLFGQTWRAWWFGDALSNFVVAPVILSWASPKGPLPRRRILEALCVGTALILVSGFIFTGVPDSPWRLFRQAYLMAPVSVWATFRFGIRGAATATLIFTSVAIWGTAQGHGPFASATLYESILGLQIFVAVAAMTLLFLAAVIEERARMIARADAINLELERAMRARDDLVSTISHELKNPLHVLQMILFSALRNLPPEERPKGHADRAKALFGRLARLIDSLLDVHRVTEGGIDLVPEQMDLSAVASTVVASMQEEAPCEIRLVADGPIVVFWDRLRIEQVLTNLVSNACKYGAGNPVDVLLEHADGIARLKVIDHGIGIPPELQERVFEKFERAVPHRKYTGFGLGLWISQRIVEAMGGRISVESTLGQGSTFVVELGDRLPPAKVATTKENPIRS